jgi:chemotaxis-related protein WspB
MLFLLFQLGPDRYAIDALRVVEVLPWVHVKGIPHAPAGIAGVINYRGAPVPVLDLCLLTQRRPAGRRLSTRLLVVQAEATGPRLLALIAEQATESLRLDPAAFVAPGVRVENAPYLGPTLPDAQGRLMQRLDLEKLLPDDVRDALFREVESAA